MAPIAISVTLAVGFPVGSRVTQVHTQGSDVHEAGEGDNPIVHGVNNETTIELGERSALGTCETESRIELTKRPSASQLFSWNMRVGTTLIALE